MDNNNCISIWNPQVLDMFVFRQPFLVVFLDLICIRNKGMLNKLVPFYTLKSNFCNDSQATKSTAGKIKQVRIFLP